jgi:hypothetical protein
MVSVGDRVRFTQSVDRFPHFIVPRGATGTVTSEDLGVIWIRVDQQIRGAEPWENEVSWDESADGPLADYVEVLGAA